MECHTREADIERVWTETEPSLRNETNYTLGYKLLLRLLLFLFVVLLSLDTNELSGSVVSGSCSISGDTLLFFGNETTKMRISFPREQFPWCCNRRLLYSLYFLVLHSSQIFKHLFTSGFLSCLLCWQTRIPVHEFYFLIRFYSFLPREIASMDSQALVRKCNID
jgi:hypothetical protein